MPPDLEASVSVPKEKFKTVKRKLHKVQFYTGMLVLIFVASLPTGFFVFHRHHDQHWFPIYNSTRPVASSPTKRVERRYDYTGPLQDNHSLSQNVSQEVVTCTAPLVPGHFNECSLPCEWTTMSPLTYGMYYGLMVVGFWLAVFAAVVSMITWSKIPSLRKFPHNLRFYLIICCILLGCCKMLPLRIGLNKVFCGSTDFWTPIGHSSFYTLLQGAGCHYFTLVNCMWATCFVANTYAVVVRDNRTLFDHPTLAHIAQSLVCWLVPAIIVASCIYIRYPAPMYSVTFIDWMGAMPAGETMTYVSVTLPMQLTLGVSLCLLWSITWYLRRSRLDSTRHTIRANEDTQSMLRIERQFTSMTVMILLVLGAVLSVTTTIGYNVENMVHQTEDYIDCLKHSSDCQPADLWIPLFAVTMLAPGFLCIVFFFLLFMNKECRQIWSDCVQRLSRVTTICLPVTRPHADTTKSRCSSTLTVLTERRLSDFALRDVITLEGKPRASSTECVKTIGPYSRTHLSPLTIEGRPRSSSTPVLFVTSSDTEMETDALMTSCVVSAPQKSAQNDGSRQFNIEVQIVGSTCGSSHDGTNSADEFCSNDDDDELNSDEHVSQCGCSRDDASNGQLPCACHVTNDDVTPVHPGSLHGSSKNTDDCNAKRVSVDDAETVISRNAAANDFCIRSQTDTNSQLSNEPDKTTLIRALSLTTSL